MNVQAFDTRYELEAFYDDRCQVCHLEIVMLRKLDKKQRIKFIDISEPGFVPESYGKTLSELHASMHARRPSGEWIIGVDVFRELYTLVGFGLPVAMSRLPLIKQALGMGYNVFARVRPYLPKRCESGVCPTNTTTGR